MCRAGTRIGVLLVPLALAAVVGCGGSDASAGRPIPTSTELPATPIASPSPTPRLSDDACQASLPMRECDALCGDIGYLGTCMLESGTCQCIPFECARCAVTFYPVPETVDGLTVTVTGYSAYGDVPEVEVQGGVRSVFAQFRPVDPSRGTDETFAAEAPLLPGINHLRVIARRRRIPPPCYAEAQFDVTALGNTP
jgi:hypothetical protein